MKKLGKSIILLGIATTAIAVSSMLQAVETIKPEILKQETQRYNHKSANMLDNVFVEGNTKYLPFIFENSTDKITEADIRADFSAAGLTVNEIKRTDELIGTGTTITVKENSDEYNVIVYGDVDGDGYVDTMDSYQIILHVKRPSTNALKGIYLKAGNILNDEDTMADTLDAYQIILFQKGRAPQLVEVEPTSTIPSNQPPVITLKDSSSIEIKVGESYSQYLDKSNAKATNKYGGDISDKVEVTHNINNAVTGTYYITYSVKDNNGVSANVVTRTVTVKSNSVTPPITKEIISIVAKDMPTKQSYNYGATKADVDMAGATITVNYNVGESDTVNVTNSMVESVDLTQAGEGIITVKYEGKTATFKVTVLKQITALTLTEDQKQNITLSADGSYNTVAKQFTLGTIKEVAQEGGSKLNIDDLNISIQKDTNDLKDLKVEAVSETNGDILLKGTTNGAGTYKLVISIYNGTVNLEKTIKVNSTITSAKLYENENELTNITLTSNNTKNVQIKIFNQYEEEMKEIGAGDILTGIEVDLKSILTDSTVGIINPEDYSEAMDENVPLLDIMTDVTGGEGVNRLSIAISIDLEDYEIDKTVLNNKTLRIVQKTSDGTLKDLCTPITISVE